ncbi:MAG TPA: hypothetical protein VIA06_24830 [Candidatus Dormibacteraeota bacterium]|nr:hypothetical protein [Candidatus Dormibacteraeota bacterium]
MISAVVGVLALVELAMGRISLILFIVAVAGLAFGISSLFHAHRVVGAIGRASALP